MEPSKRCVLYVDDEPALLEICKLFLESEGNISVDIIASAPEALDILKKKNYDVIISDYQMPEMDGLEFLKRVRATDKTIPFILFTGRGREEVVIDAINNGVDFYIQKGGDPKAQFAELSHKIRKAVSRQQAEQSLIESEKRLSDIINFLPDATFAINREGAVIAWNRAIEEMTGCPASAMLEKGDYEYAIPFYGKRRPILIDLVLLSEEEFIRSNYSSVKKEGAILIAETTDPHPKGRQRTLHGTASVLYDKKGNVSGAIESIRDVTDRRKDEDELRAAYEQITASEEELRNQVDELTEKEKTIRISEVQFRNVIDFSPLGMHFYEMQPDGSLIFTGANPSADTILKVENREFIGKTIEDAFPGLVDTEIPAQYKNVARNGGVWHTDQSTYDKGFIRGAFSVTAFRIRPGAMVAVFFDITRRKRAEEALRESEATYRAILDTMQDVFYRSDAAGNLITTSPSGLNLLKYDSLDELKGKNISSDIWFYPESRQAFLDDMKKTGSVRNYEVVLRRKDGSPVRVATSSHFWYDKNGSLAGIEGNLHDITAACEADEQIKLLAGLTDISPASIIVHDVEGTILYVNERTLELHGWSRDEFMALNIHQLDVPVTSAQFYEGIRRLKTTGTASFDVEHYRKDGSTFPLRVNAKVTRWNDREVILSVAMDISEQKQSEAALREKSEELDQYFTTSLDLFCIADTDGKFRRLNPEWERTLGYTLAEMEGHLFFGFVHPDDLPETLVAVSQLSDQQEILNFTNRYRHKDGTWRWIEWRSRPKGELIFAAARDITERKMAEDLLHQERAMSNAIIDLNAYGIQIFDARGHHVRANPAFLTMFKSAPPADYCFFDDPVPKKLGNTKANLEAGKTLVNPEVWYNPHWLYPEHPDHLACFRSVAFPIISAEGKMESFVVMFEDVTERKLAGDEILRIAHEWQRTFDAMEDAVWILDKDHRILRSNVSAERIFGQPNGVMIGKHCWEIVHGTELPTNACPSVRAQKSLHRETMVLPIGDLWFEVIADPQFDATGGYAGAVHIVRDITERTRATMALKESEAEFRDFFNNTSDAIVIHNPQGQFLEVNDEICRRLGYSREEMLNMNPAEIDDPECAGQILNRISELQQTGRAVFETVHLRKDGTRIPTEVSGRVITYHGKPAIIVTGRDITARKQGEAALRESEGKLRRMFDQSPVGVAMVSLDFRFQRANEAFCKTFGYSEEELRSRTFADITHPDHIEADKKNVSRVLVGEILEYSTEKQYIRKDGRVIWAATSVRLVKDSNGKSLYFLPIIVDITTRKEAELGLQKMNEQLAAVHEELKAQNSALEVDIAARKKVEAALRESEERFKHVVDNAGEWIWEIDPDGLYRYCSSAVEEILGYTPEELVGRMHFYDLFPPDVREELKTVIVAGLGRRESFRNFINSNLHKNGQTVILETSAIPIFDNQNKFCGYRGADLNITERSRAEDALAKNRFQLAQAMELAHTVKWEFDVKTGIFTFNDRFYSLYGTNAEREGGYQMPAEVYAREFVHPDDAAMVDEEVNKVIQAIDPDYKSEVEHRIIRRDGEIRYIIVRMGIVKDAAGRTIRSYGANQDITERKKVEDALRLANRKLTLLSSVTRHDIRNQLTALDAFFEISEKTLTDPTKTSEFIEREKRISKNIARQIRFTREYEKLGVQSPIWQNVDKRVRQATAGLSIQNIAIDVGIPDLEVFADPLLEKVFYNLIDNALRYGGVRMTTIRISSQESGSGLLISVQDNGVGIPAGDKARVFDRGFGKNTGLGLYLAQEILSITGITITENGEPGKGARFEIAVPKGLYRSRGSP